LPRGPWEWNIYGPSFEPVCDEPAACANGAPRNPGGISPCECSGAGTCQLPGENESNCADLPQLEVVDTVHIPEGIEPGEYVLVPGAGIANSQPKVRSHTACVALDISITTST
jgi:hypothetical protein